MRVLVVDDHPLIRNAMRSALETMMETVSIDFAGSLEDAFRQSSASDQDLVLLDLNLPDGDGLELLQHLPRRDDAPTVVVVTARDQVSDRIRGLDTGADDYLVKPYDPEELLARLRAIERRRSR